MSTKDEIKLQIQNGIYFKDDRYRLHHNEQATSHVWNIFYLIEYEGQKLNYVCCKKCKAVLSYTPRTGTGGLLRHKCPSSKKRVLDDFVRLSSVSNDLQPHNHKEDKLDRDKPVRSGKAMRKTLLEYKAALNIKAAMAGKNPEQFTRAEKKNWEWATTTIDHCGTHLSQIEEFKPRDPLFVNCIEKTSVKNLEKRNASSETSSSEDDVTLQPKRFRRSLQSGFRLGTAPKQTCNNQVSKYAVKKTKMDALIIALIDRNSRDFKISQEAWMKLELKLIEKLLVKMDDGTNAMMPSYEAAGWVQGAKIIICKDQYSVDWFSQAVLGPPSLLDGAKLEIVHKDKIPTPRTAGVWFPYYLPKTLELLKRQNPDIPTDDWKILKVKKQREGQDLTIQINKEAEDLLYERYGKMSWGIGSVYLRLQIRNSEEQNYHTLEPDEVEKDLQFTSDATVNMPMQHDHDSRDKLTKIVIEKWSDQEMDGLVTTVTAPPDIELKPLDYSSSASAEDMCADNPEEDSYGSPEGQTTP